MICDELQIVDGAGRDFGGRFDAFDVVADNLSDAATIRVVHPTSAAGRDRQALGHAAAAWGGAGDSRAEECHREKPTKANMLHHQIAAPDIPDQVLMAPILLSDAVGSVRCTVSRIPRQHPVGHAWTHAIADHRDAGTMIVAVAAAPSDAEPPKGARS